jgi:hypothetical protein
MVVETFEKLQCKDKLQKVKELQTKSKTGFGIGYLFPSLDAAIVRIRSFLPAPEHTKSAWKLVALS